MAMEVNVGTPDASGMTSFTCKNCGATTSFSALGKSIVCPFCGSQYVIARPNDPNTPQPEALLPFNVPDTQVQQIYRTWLGIGFFKPRDLTQLATNHKMRAVFLPVWECSGRAYSEWTATAGYDYQRQEQYQERACDALVPGDRHKDLRVQTQVHDLAGRLLSLPIWLASFQYKGDIYRCVVNGQTGTIGGEAPVSKAKVALVVVGVLAAVILIIIVIMLIGRHGGSGVVPTPTRRRRRRGMENGGWRMKDG